MSLWVSGIKIISWVSSVWKDLFVPPFGNFINFCLMSFKSGIVWGLSWRCSGEDSALSLPWLGLGPWSGDSNPVSPAVRQKKKKGLFYFETNLYILSEKLFPEEPRTITVFLFFLGCCKYRYTINKCIMPDKGMHIPSQDVVLNIHSF